MYRKFIATVSAAAIALTAMGSAPAFADQRDTNRALAALLGLAVVGAIIHDRNKDKKRQVHRPAPVHKKHVQKRHKQHAHKPHRIQPRPLPQRVNRKLLPQQCFRSVQTHQGTYRMFGQRCLNRHYTHVRSLPQQCRYVFPTFNGQRTGYEARCLRNAGYRLARG